MVLSDEYLCSASEGEPNPQRKSGGDRPGPFLFWKGFVQYCRGHESQQSKNLHLWNPPRIPVQNKATGLFPKCEVANPNSLRGPGSRRSDRSDYLREVIADDAKVLWKNVDLSPEERKHMPDLNPLGIGTQIDFDLHSLREWLWVIRTAKSIKHSALMICGFAHTTGVADKFRSVGFDVETHVYFDGTDNGHIENRIE